MTQALSTDNGADFLRLMKRYVIDYTNSHDQDQTWSIMVPDYVLRMGSHFVTGRDTQYRAATRKQMDQFPGLMLTVHEIWTSGERLMMRFSEHGASGKHGGALAAWGGIGLYEWDGERLIRNHVEQDYLSRARQLSSGIPVAVEGPATAPWDVVPAKADPDAENVVRASLKEGDITAHEAILCDDAWAGIANPPVLDQVGIEINDLFSCGGRVGFHVSQTGKVLPGGLPDDEHVGDMGTLYMAGILEVVDEKIVSGRIIRNRIELKRALRKDGP